MGHRIEDLTPTFGRFVDAEGREALAAEPLVVADVRSDKANRYGPRWLVVGALVSTGELVTIGLAENAGRDALFGKLAAMLAEGENVEPVILYRHQPDTGNAFWTFRSASADELAAAKARGAALGAGDDDDSAGPAPDETDAPVLRRGRAAK